MKVLYFGTPRFAADVLTYLLENGVDIVGVITKPDRPQGRSGQPVPTLVKSAAQAQIHPITVLQPEIVSSSEHVSTLEAFQADLFVVVAYGEIIKQHLLDMPKVACINLHASLLPKYRGAAPIQRSIINGEAETGITIMHMAKKMDAGDIISMVKVPIGSNTTYGELEMDLCREGSKLLLQTIRDFESGKTDRVLQDHTLATMAPKIELENCLVDWNQSSQDIHNLVRGVNPHPGAWCWVSIKGQRKRLRIISTEVISTNSESPPGSHVLNSKEGVIVNCGKGSLRLLHIQLEGKKIMTSQEFARGLGQDSTTNFNFLF